jgi:magnesium-transporting ATPase (P-type)
MCRSYYANADSVLPLSDVITKRVLAKMEEWANMGLRVLAFAHGPVVPAFLFARAFLYLQPHGLF